MKEAEKHGKKQTTCKACSKKFTPMVETQKYCTIACAITQFPIVGTIKIRR